MKILFAMSRLLGGNTFTREVQRAVADFGDVEPQWLFLDADAFRKHPDHWQRPFESQRIMRRRYDAEITEDYDILFLSGFESILGFRDIIKKKPTILAADGTNLGAYRLLADLHRTGRKKLEYWLKGIITKPLYAPTISRIDHFLPRSTWCANQFIHDYGVNQTRITTLPLGLDLTEWAPSEQSKDPGLVLFAGNDFYGKGGDILLEAFASLAASGQQVRLRVISNDPVLKNLALPENVEWVVGVDTAAEIRKHYQQASLFVFPTRQDRLGLVLIEAAACGLPILATDIAGISDVVKDPLNGSLLPLTADCRIWRDHICASLADQKILATMGAASRRHAQQNYSASLFSSKLKAVLDNLFEKTR